MTIASNVRSMTDFLDAEAAMGWQVHKTDAEFDPWVASNLETGETVFGRDLDDLAEQCPPLTIVRHIAKARREMGEERWQQLSAEWL